MPSFEKAHPRSKSKRRKGYTYEEFAAAYFRQHGYTVLERNWQAGHKEIDLIVRKGDVVAFVEVKSVSTREYGHPAERIDDKKIEHLTRAVQQYLIDNGIEGCDLRFDVVTFVGGKLEHYPDAFQAPE
ncbi:MAG: YraN family protein [Candidatus Zixiibacteriota bacterium]